MLALEQPAVGATTSKLPSGVNASSDKQQWQQQQYASGGVAEPKLMSGVSSSSKLQRGPKSSTRPFRIGRTHVVRTQVKRIDSSLF